MSRNLAEGLYLSVAVLCAGLCVGMTVIFLFHCIRTIARRRQAAAPTAHMPTSIAATRPTPSAAGQCTWMAMFFRGAITIPLRDDDPADRLMAAHQFLRVSRLGWNRAHEENA